MVRGLSFSFYRSECTGRGCIGFDGIYLGTYFLGSKFANMSTLFDGVLEGKFRGASWVGF